MPTRSNSCAAFLGRIEPEHLYSPAIRLAQAFNDLNRRGFPGAVWPHHTKNLAGINFKGNVVDGLQAAVGFMQIFNLNHRLHNDLLRKSNFIIGLITGIYKRDFRLPPFADNGCLQ